MEAQVFNETLQEKTRMAERIIRSFLPEETGYQKTVIEAMNYSITVGGKRLRPLLMAETFHFCGGREEDMPLLEPFMAAIEMIHTYSLIHDDLPPMDNDEYRRGKKTTWSAYGETMGLLAGDGLLNYAFETALQALEFCSGADRDYLTTAPSPEYNMQRVTKAMRILAKKAGIYGMIGGQTADIEAESREGSLEKEQLLFIHGHKTAALIQAAMLIGAVIAGVSKEEQLAQIGKCAYDIGVAFQIQDDILDVVGDSEELGKPVGSDEQNHKQTYVTVNGLEQSRQDVAELTREAIEILDSMEGRNDFLKELLLSLVQRRK
ncbi:MAG: polyprenyl synthetase family protein [Lachnospiraceae bacterium]|nr:polyprenyl synthetase family protein [Lachnospiraceae bacterium]MCM1241141.1 polyprenyl synthetase family protein [Lachnospiraceae bacterium]